MDYGNSHSHNTNVYPLLPLATGVPAKLIGKVVSLQKYTAYVTDFAELLQIARIKQTPHIVIYISLWYGSNKIC
jgi:hypothetical protein